MQRFAATGYGWYAVRGAPPHGTRSYRTWEPGTALSYVMRIIKSLLVSRWELALRRLSQGEAWPTTGQLHAVTGFRDRLAAGSSDAQQAG